MSDFFPLVFFFFLSRMQKKGTGLVGPRSTGFGYPITTFSCNAMQPSNANHEDRAKLSPLHFSLRTNFAKGCDNYAWQKSTLSQTPNIDTGPLIALNST